MSGPNVEFLKDFVSQALEIDDKDSEQLHPLSHREKIPCIDYFST